MRPYVNNSLVNRKHGFSDNEHVWLCFTSLWHRRYVENVTHIVGLPSGARVRLRYDKQYVDAALWNQVSDGILSDDIVVIISLLDADSIEPPQATPLRRCRLVSVGCQGSVIVMDVALGDFLLAGPDRSAFWNDVKNNGRNLPKKNCHGRPPSGYFLQKLTKAPTSVQRDDSIQAWEKVAMSVFAIDDNVNPDKAQRQIPFLFFISGLNKGLKRSLLCEGSLVCEGGVSFSLDVHTIMRKEDGKIANPIGEVHMEASHPAAKFITSRRIRVDSPRDVKTIELSTSAAFRRVDGHLSVRSVYFEHLPNEDNSRRTAAQESEGCSPSAETVNGYSTAMIAASRRDEIIVSRYDFSFSVGRTIPLVACSIAALAAAVATFEVPKEGAATLADFAQPLVVFLFAFVGLRIGLRGGEG